MKTIRDWFSCQLIPRSLLSARPLSFPDGESQERSTVSLLEHACPDSSQSINSDFIDNSSSQLQLATEGVPRSVHSNARTHNFSDPLVKVEDLLVNYLRLILRLDLPLSNPVVAQVLYRLQLAGLIQSGESEVKRTGIDISRATALAADRETSSQIEVDLSIKILVLGKTGVGKSSTINSIFDHNHAETNAFQPSTECVHEISGNINGIKLTIIDTPGLSPSKTNHRRNRIILHSIKRFIKKSPPDLVLYVERLDLIHMGYSDFPLLKLVTDIFGSSLWFNAILVMTHCSAPLPEGPDGYSVTYESFVRSCTNLVKHYIHQVVSDTRVDIPVLLVENHLQCKRNREGEKILPSGEAWRCRFFLLCTSSKILTDANRLLKFRECIPGAKNNKRSPSLPHLLSMFLHPRSRSAGGDNENKLGESFDISVEGDCKKLPPFRTLTKAEFQRLSKAQRSAYLDEIEYRETLYLKKQWKEELRRRERARASRRTSTSKSYVEVDDLPDITPLTDMAIPITFDSEYPVYRYRSLFYNSQHVVRPVLDSEGWDHDINFDGINLESSVVLNKNLNASVVGQMNKGKGEFSIQAESMLKYRDPGKPALSAGLDLQTSGRDLIYTVKGDAEYKTSKCNVAELGLSLTSFRDIHLPGVKIEDVLALGNRFFLHINAGSLFCQGQAAHGGGLEVTILGRDHPVRNDKIVVGTSLISFEKETVLGGNVQSSFRAGRGVRISTNMNLNNRRMGRISIKTSTSEHVEIALAAALGSIAWAFFASNRSREA